MEDHKTFKTFLVNSPYLKMFFNCLFGELAIGDAKNLIQDIKLRGTERVIVEMVSIRSDTGGNNVIL